MCVRVHAEVFVHVGSHSLPAARVSSNELSVDAPIGNGSVPVSVKIKVDHDHKESCLVDWQHAGVLYDVFMKHCLREGRLVNK